MFRSSNNNVKNNVNVNNNAKSTKGNANNSNSKTSSYSAVGVIGILAILVLMIVLIFLTIYIVYKIQSKDTTTSKLMDENFVNLEDKRKMPYLIPSDRLSKSVRGQEYTLNFWIYLSDNYDATTQHKIIIQRGQELSGSAIVIEPTTSPIIAMDKDNNQMLFAVSTTQVKNAMPLDKVFERDVLTRQFVSPYLVTAIDYVPLQRWINVTMIVIDNILRVYIDGDIYSVVTTNDIKGATGVPLIKMNDGDMYIGSSTYPTKGHLAKLSYSNYAIPQSTLKSMYSKGPSEKSWLSFVGLGRYGVQSPVYRID